MSEKPGEVTVVLSREEAAVLHDSRKQWGLRISETQKGARDKLEAALAAYDAAQNPLGLPWEAEDGGKDDGFQGCWRVRFVGDCNDSDVNLTEAQARLMAAAPEMADALGEMLDSVHRGAGEQLAAIRAGETALLKAGRRD